MKVLAIDTSSKNCSAAIIENEKVINETHNISELEHSQTLMPMVKDLLEKTDLTLDDIDMLACGKGPGSFTGVRIGIATLKAFSDAKNIPMIGIDSLEALAYSAIIAKKRESQYNAINQEQNNYNNRDTKQIQNCKILTMIDARYDNVYFAVYRMHNGNLLLYKNAQVININDTVDYIDLEEPLYIVGDANPEKLEPLIITMEDSEKAEGKDTKEHEYITNKLPTMAEAIGIATIEKYKNGTAIIENVSPMYLRKPQAERILEGQDIKKNEHTDIYILEMSETDTEQILKAYKDFPNLWNEEIFKNDIENSKYIVAKEDDEILGFTGYRIVFDEMEIMNIVTKESKRKNGIASDMLSYLIRKNKVERINLEVNENNIPAINLYKKFGFKQVGLRKKYYDNKDDAILMSI